HIFCGSGHGFAVASGAVFCARRGDGFSARASVEGRAHRLGREWNVADVVGTRAGGVTVEPWIVRGDEVPLLLLLGFGAGADARAGGAAWNDCERCAHDDSGDGACADVGDSGVLRGARITGATGRLEVFCERGERAAEARTGEGSGMNRA